MIDEPVSAAACAFIRIGYISELGDLKDCTCEFVPQQETSMLGFQQD